MVRPVQPGIGYRKSGLDASVVVGNNIRETTRKLVNRSDNDQVSQVILAVQMASVLQEQMTGLGGTAAVPLFRLSANDARQSTEK